MQDEQILSGIPFQPIDRLLIIVTVSGSRRDGEGDLITVRQVMSGRAGK